MSPEGLVLLAGVFAFIGVFLCLIAFSRPRPKAPKHRCTWETTGARYTPPQDLTQVYFKGRDHEMASDILRGFTIISQRCTGCGDVRSKKLTGEYVASGVPRVA